MKIAVITYQNRFYRGFNDFYPLFKWESELRISGLDFLFFSSFDNVNADSDIIILDYRYLVLLGGQSESSRSYIIDSIHKLRRRTNTIILFETGDGSGSGSFWMINHVDLCLKKQILKDRNLYLGNSYTSSYMKWVPDQIVEEVFKDDFSYVGCQVDQLHKIQLGWNIAYVDYRNLPLGRFYPSAVIPESIISGPTFLEPNPTRNISISFRGTNHTVAHYHYQRSRIIQVLSKLKVKDNAIIDGGKVTRKKYLAELANSTSIVSPFGWGEICYRDFEAFIFGCLLIKPDMNHIDTFPNLFSENETYIPFKWDVNDFEEKLIEIKANISKYIEVAKHGQQQYKQVKDNFELFYNHLIAVLKFPAKF